MLQAPALVMPVTVVVRVSLVSVDTAVQKITSRELLPPGHPQMAAQVARAEQAQPVVWEGPVQKEVMLLPVVWVPVAAGEATEVTVPLAVMVVREY
ncbi:hypothetical protein E5475_20775 [Salmonella enterica]|nr:hypothetical protein [Salmonella enterica]EHM1373173.1 hypothetical protein [Salmonella enterica]